MDPQLSAWCVFCLCLRGGCNSSSSSNAPGGRRRRQPRLCRHRHRFQAIDVDRSGRLDAKELQR